MTDITALLNAEALDQLRWDHEQALVNTEGLRLCSLCSRPIPENTVPFIVWKNDGVDMATVGRCCDQALFNTDQAAGLPLQEGAAS